MGLAGMVAAGALLIVLGLPVRWLLRPFAMLFRPIGFLFRPDATAIRVLTSLDGDRRSAPDEQP